MLLIAGSRQRRTGRDSASPGRARSRPGDALRE